MDADVFDKLKSYIDFGPEDEKNLRCLSANAEELIPQVAERVYAELERNPDARVAFTGGETQVDRQLRIFAEWMTNLLRDAHDASYLDKRIRIGAGHVRAGVEQHYVITGIQLVWDQFSRAARAAKIPKIEPKLRSFHKLLALELAVMLDSYKDSYAEIVRRSERRAVEEKLTRAEHLAEIGQLAASLAHEIKNPLAGISGAIQIIRDAMAPDDPHRHIITEIVGQIKRLDATVKDLLQYARPAPPRFTEFPVGPVLARVLKVLREEPAMQGVQVKGRQVASDVSIYGDDSQIEQLIINLILNAAQASKDRGAIQLAVTEENNRVILVVRDFGKGMTPEIRDQAFEPFFTTKARGTGLGLSICRRIVEAHGGHIELESEINRGTTVTVDLPHRAQSVQRRRSDDRSRPHH